MSEPRPTLADLRVAGIVSSVEIAHAVGAYVAAPDRGPHRFASGHTLDVRAAVEADPRAAAAFADPTVMRSQQRVAVAEAIMPSRPTPPRT